MAHIELIATASKLITRSSTLIKNTGWMLLSEGAARATRLLTVIALAAYLTSSEYGVAALALACHELFRVLVRVGAGAKIIQCSDADLPLITRNGASLQWIIYGLLAGLQIALAPLIAAFYQNPELQYLLQWMAISYFFYPLVSIRVCMLQRQNNMRLYSVGNAACAIIENGAIVVLLWLDAGLYAVAYAKIIAAVAWVSLFIHVRTPSFGVGLHIPTLLMLARYSSKLLATEFMRSLRSQLDVFIAGRLLPAELFGVYSFAKNAGVGLSLSLSSAYLSVLYPHVCKLQRANNDGANHNNVFYLSLVLAGVFIAQALVAPFYIEWFFAERWHASANLVSLLCLTAIPALFIDTECCLLRAANRIEREFFLMSLCVVSSALLIAFATPATPLAMAYCLVVSSLLWPLLFIHRRFPITFTSSLRVSL